VSLLDLYCTAVVNYNYTAVVNYNYTAKILQQQKTRKKLQLLVLLVSEVTQSVYHQLKLNRQLISMSPSAG